MIFPFLAGILSFRRAPATWSIIILNLLVITLLHLDSKYTQQDLENLAKDETFAVLQGRIFSTFVLQESARYPASYKTIAAQALRENDNYKNKTMGLLAMRDSYFLSQEVQSSVAVDPIEYAWWKKKSREFQLVRNSLITYDLGVTDQAATATNWLTYQFTHSDWAHFLSNMVIFLLFGAALELTIGPLALVVVTVMSGIFSALIFLWLDQATAVPLIGASGAVSGVIALYCMLYWRTGVRHVYFLFIPRQEYMGFVYMPAWLVLMFWVIADMAGFMGTPVEMGGIAYSAHLGGELCGVLVGLILFGWRYWRGEKSVLPPSGVMSGPSYLRY